MKFSNFEIKELQKSWLALTVAFTILISRGSTLPFWLAFIMSGFTVGLGFIIHELSHKYAAQKLQCWAEFRANNQMLLLAIIFSFFGFIFAAPGAVMIQGHINKHKNGIISTAGPLSNFIVAGIFLALAFIPIPYLSIISAYGFMINSWLGLFNLIPILNFDGSKILAWNKIVYASMVIAGIALLMIQGVVL